MAVPEFEGSTMLGLFTNVNNVFGDAGIGAILAVAWILLSIILAFVSKLSTAMMLSCIVMIIVSGGAMLAGMVSSLVPLGFVVLLGVVFFASLLKDF